MLRTTWHTRTAETTLFPVELLNHIPTMSPKSTDSLLKRVPIYYPFEMKPANPSSCCSFRICGMMIVLTDRLPRHYCLPRRERCCRHFSRSLTSVPIPHLFPLAALRDLASGCTPTIFSPSLADVMFLISRSIQDPLSLRGDTAGSLTQGSICRPLGEVGVSVTGTMFKVPRLPGTPSGTISGPQVGPRTVPYYSYGRIFDGSRRFYLSCLRMNLNRTGRVRPG